MLVDPRGAILATSALRLLEVRPDRHQHLAPGLDPVIEEDHVHLGILAELTQGRAAVSFFDWSIRDSVPVTSLMLPEMSTTKTMRLERTGTPW